MLKPLGGFTWGIPGKFYWGHFMRNVRSANFAIAFLLIGGLGLGGCTTAVIELAKKALEDRSSEDQVTDTKIGAGILERLAGRDKGLLLDVSTDTWEQRVMLTGTLDSAGEKAAVEKLVAADKRIKAIYRHIKIVKKATKNQRRAQSEKKGAEKKGGIGQTVNDLWIETKISAQLLTTKKVTSVNYRWRSVLNDLYVIGRARTPAERANVLKIIRETEGVKSVQHHIAIKPAKK
jgi:osmotically-inducible protein OsmY